MRKAVFSAPALKFSPRLTVLTLVFYFAFLAAHAPASLLAWTLAYSTKGTINLYGTQGLVWRGRATTLVITDYSGRAYRFERLQWEWLRARLFAGEVAVRMQIDGPSFRGSSRIALGAEGARVSQASFRLPASLLAMYQPSLLHAGLSGEITLHSEDFLLSEGRYAGTATVEWRDASSILASVHPLGSYQVLVTGAGDRADLQVNTVRGVLLIEGHGSWSPRKALSLDGAAHSEPSYQTELRDVLRLLGPDSGTGMHKISIENYQDRKPQRTNHDLRVPVGTR